MQQPTLFDGTELAASVTEWLSRLIRSARQPSAEELVSELEEEHGLDARFVLIEVVIKLSQSPDLNNFQKSYLQSLLHEDCLPAALLGGERIGKSVESSIDALLESTKRYRNSSEFRQLLSFMARFREYAPYNNMLIRIQNPSCNFFASKRDWEDKFGRHLKEDARPMLILAVMGPLMCVYDVDQTEGKELPGYLKNFSKFEGDWNQNWLDQLIENANNYKIKVGIKELSSTNSGFATTRALDPWKMRIAIHSQLDSPSQFGVLCHELAHVLLGHLGQDPDGWWPGRVNLTHTAVEVEAESVAYLVTERFGLRGTSDAYLGALTGTGMLPQGVSLDNVARVAGLVERMAKEPVKPTTRKRTGARK